MKKRAILPLLLALSLLLSLFSCGTADPSPKSRTYYDYFDTPILLSDYSGRSTADFSSLAARIESELSRYHKLYDIYNEYDGIVNIATLNRHAGKGALKVSRELFDLIKFGKRAYELTGGEVNIAMGAVLSRWHDCRTLALETGKTTLPSDSELKELYSHSNIDDLILDEQALTVELRDERMSLDVGAVAKGYATEQIAKMLESEGVTSFVINAGGNVRMIGKKPSGNGWVIGIENPLGSGYSYKLTASDTSIVTSGAYQRYFTLNGKNYGHIIDKDTLYPAEHHLSVSVVIKDSGLADVLSTALFTMSYEEGLSLIRSVEGSECYWVLPDGTVVNSD